MSKAAGRKSPLAALEVTAWSRAFTLSFRAKRGISFVALACLVAPLRARADGALPDEIGVFFPKDVPGETVLAATFGLLVTHDGGADFGWICEEPGIAPQGNLVTLYQVADDGTILADTGSGIYRSADGACTWAQAQGSVANVLVVDAAFDPSDASDVLALTENDPAYGQGAIKRSSDEGATFGPTVWAGNANLTGVEFARSQPGRVYVTGNADCQGVGAEPPFLLRSDDSGRNWTFVDLSYLGNALVRIAQVDPQDANTVYFRLTTLGGGDWLLWTHDGGQTIEGALHLSWPMSGFLRATDGTIYVSTTQDELYRLSPGGSAFQRMVGGPHFRALAENQGEIWGCGASLTEGMALGYSRDQGQTFCATFDFHDITGMLACGAVPQQCASLWGPLSQLLEVGQDAGPLPCLTESDGGQVAVGASPLPTTDAGPACVLQFATLDAGADAGEGDGGADDAGSFEDAGAPLGRGGGCNCAAGGEFLLLPLFVYALQRKRFLGLRARNDDAPRPGNARPGTDEAPRVDDVHRPRPEGRHSERSEESLSHHAVS